jgi:S-adenosylmethionine:tRNA ribosyltransferase-isomerase
VDELDQYDYTLPKDLIAQQPASRRVDARLMVVRREQGEIEHHHIRDLPQLLHAPDCLVLNDTRVVPARLLGRRALTGGRWEGLFLADDGQGLWQILGKTRGKLTPGESIQLTNAHGQDDIELLLIDKRDDGVWIARPRSSEATLPLLERVGRIPLPHYIREGAALEEDVERYQTVFARHAGSAAAPTAGLHFSRELLDQLESQGVSSVRVTLHVGLDTFRPVTVTSLAEHKMHSEWGRIEADAVEKLRTTRKRGGRVVAVGTTATRVLETAARSGELTAWTGQTELFIRPPFEFHAVDALLTNFHLPRTTLLVLVRTFGGDALLKRAYEEAIRERYRFYSYGDAMLIL